MQVFEYTKKLAVAALAGVLVVAAVQAAQGVTLAHIIVTENGDTLPHVSLPPVYCFAKPKFK
ncbi:MAG: hypothetical protein LBS94_03435, partial [Prevotellaceae bacterium]|nr:hypothetical protein [Prevotellaceae bacterium]